MRAKIGAERITAVASLKEFFKDSVAEAMEKQRVAADDRTAYYVVNLLTLYSRTDAVPASQEGRGFPALALMLAAAAQSDDAQERDLKLQCVGDTSLFVAGFFGDGLAMKPVDVDYYIELGGAAYDTLAVNMRGTVRGHALCAVFAELANKFREFVDVLAEVRDAAKAASDHDLLRLYEVWLKTRSERAARLLRECGIEPNRLLDASTRH